MTLVTLLLTSVSVALSPSTELYLLSNHSTYAVTAKIDAGLLDQQDSIFFTTHLVNLVGSNFKMHFMELDYELNSPTYAH